MRTEDKETSKALMTLVLAGTEIKDQTLALKASTDPGLTKASSAGHRDRPYKTAGRSCL